MKIGIIGGGAAGIICALKIKEMHPNYDVVILEKKEKLGKKLLATGNGKCNLGNLVINDDSYNSSFAKEIVSNNKKELEDMFLSLGIPLKHNNDLIYPWNESAKETVDILTRRLQELGVVVFLNCVIKDYFQNGNRVVLITEDGKLNFDKIVITCGGKAAPKLGSDGSFYSVLEKKGYKVITPTPGLCPLRTIEKTKNVSGIRVKCTVSLLKDNEIINEETGEVLFKDDGISGIVIFNMASRIARMRSDNLILSLDLFPTHSLDELITLFKKMNNLAKSYCFLRGFFQNQIVQLLLQRLKIDEKNNFYDDEILKIARLCKQLRFHVKDFYSFDNSQVTIGGISLDDIDLNFHSKKEENVYLAGEILNVDGLCGGYNLMWAFISSILVAKNI